MTAFLVPLVLIGLLFAVSPLRLSGAESGAITVGHAARADVHVRFSASSVVERVEQVYRQLLSPDAA